MDGALTPNAGEADRAVNVQPLIATCGNAPPSRRPPAWTPPQATPGAVVDQRISTTRDDKFPAPGTKLVQVAAGEVRAGGGEWP